MSSEKEKEKGSETGKKERKISPVFTSEMVRAIETALASATAANAAAANAAAAAMQSQQSQSQSQTQDASGGGAAGTKKKSGGNTLNNKKKNPLFDGTGKAEKLCFLWVKSKHPPPSPALPSNSNPLLQQVQVQDEPRLICFRKTFGPAFKVRLHPRISPTSKTSPPPIPPPTMEIEMFTSTTQSGFPQILNERAPPIAIISTTPNPPKSTVSALNWQVVNPPPSIRQKLEERLEPLQKPKGLPQVTGELLQPFVEYLRRYKEAWESGASQEVLGRVVKAVKDGVPLALLERGARKVEGWAGRVAESVRGSGTPPSSPF